MANLSVNSSELWMLNKEQWILDIGIVIYLGVVMLFGIVGNAFVSYIYYFKLDKTPSNLFVAALSYCDLFGCLISIPLHIVVILHPYTFNNNAGCRVIHFLIMDNAINSAAIVLAISIDRFKKIALPLGEQMTHPQVVKVCIAIVIASTIVSLSCFYVYAVQEVTTHRLNLTGMQCTLSNKGHMAYLIFVMIISVTFSVALCTLYCLIWIKLYRYKKKRVFLNGSLCMTISKTDLCTAIDAGQYMKEQRPLDIIETNPNEISPIMFRPRRLSIPVTKKLQRSFIRTSRTTLIMCLVSFFWLLSYLPNFAAVILLAIKPNLKYAGHTILGIGLRSCYFNNAANPWIYGIFNSRFRQEVIILLQKAACQ